MYVNVCISLGESIYLIHSVIKSLQEGDEDFKLTDEGTIDKHLGVLIKDIDETKFLSHF